MPTISEGLAGLMEVVFSAVFTRRPPITRSYSRPSSLRTVSIAARIWRAFSGLLKSTDGSFLNCVRTLVALRPSRVGASVVVINVFLSVGWFSANAVCFGCTVHVHLVDVKVLLVQGRVALHQQRLAGE